MKVIHLLAPAPFGGLERVVQSLATAQHRRGYSTSVAAMVERGRSEPPLLQSLRDAGVPVIPLAASPRGYRTQVASIRRLAETVQPDIIHMHGYLADVLSVVALGRCNYGLVSTVHGFTGGSRKNRFYEWLDVRALSRLDRVVAVSGKLAKDLAARGLSPERTDTIVNAWEPATSRESRDAIRRILGLGDDTFVVGWIGRVTREKGLDVFIEALPYLNDMPARFVVIGDGRERAALEQRARELDVSNRVDWRGAVTNAGRMLPAFDVLVMSSRTEGTPMVMLEAMDACVAIVSTSVGGIPDILSGDCGLLTPTEDSRALADSIRRVWQDPSSAADRATRAKARLTASFAIDPWVDHYDDVYRHALTHRSAR